jgi:hypothetical protein
MDFGCDNVAEVTGALVHHSFVITFRYMLGVVVTLQVDNCVLDAELVDGMLMSDLCIQCLCGTDITISRLRTSGCVCVVCMHGSVLTNNNSLCIPPDMQLGHEPI